MENAIHPTAVIDPKARLGTGNYIGPFCVIGPNVTLGSNNRLESHVSLGTPAEHRDYFLKPAGPVVIGDHNIIREFVTVNGGTTGTTSVGHHCTLLKGSHVGHDAVIRDHVNLACLVTVGGHSVVGTGANIGLSGVIHQFRVIGAFTMVGMNSTVTRNILPFTLAFGSPCEPQRVNRIGLVRNGVPEQDLFAFESWFNSLQGQFENPTDLKHSFQKYLQEYKADAIPAPPLKIAV